MLKRIRKIYLYFLKKKFITLQQKSGHSYNEIEINSIIKSLFEKD